jgi:hypothetical protein
MIGPSSTLSVFLQPPPFKSASHLFSLHSFNGPQYQRNPQSNHALKMNSRRPFRPSTGADTDIYDDQPYEDDRQRVSSSQGYESGRKGKRSSETQSDMKSMLTFDALRSFNPNSSTRNSRWEEERDGVHRQAILG